MSGNKLSCPGWMLKKLIISCLLLLSISSMAHAEEEVHDGWWWVSKGHIAKGYFLEGLHVGISEASKNEDYKDLRREDYMKVVDAMDLIEEENDK